MTSSTDHHTQATRHETAAHDSFERCDTDGFLTQHAHGLMAQQARLQATIQEAGGVATFPALFDLAGNLIPAKRVQGRYGPVWGLLSNDNPDGRFIGWFRESQAANPAVARRNDAKKGYYIGYVNAPAKAELGGGGTGLAGMASVHAVARRTDGGFSRDVEVIDNGHSPDSGAWYRR